MQRACAVLSGRTAMASMSSSGLLKLAYVVLQQEVKTHVEEGLRGAQRVPVVAGEGQGKDCRVNGWELR